MNPPELCRLDAIAEGAATTVQTVLNGKTAELLLVRRGDTVWAYHNRCPHFSVGLDARPGVICTYHGKVLMCAHHSALFRFEDGLCVDGPCLGHRLSAVAVRVVEGRIVLAESA